MWSCICCYYLFGFIVVVAVKTKLLFRNGVLGLAINLCARGWVGRQGMAFIIEISLPGVLRQCVGIVWSLIASESRFL